MFDKDWSILSTYSPDSVFFTEGVCERKTGFITSDIQSDQSTVSINLNYSNLGRSFNDLVADTINGDFFVR